MTLTTICKQFLNSVNLIPDECLLCRNILSRSVQDGQNQLLKTPNLCESCFSQLPHLKTACKRCASPLANNEPRCGHCLKHLISYDQSYCPFQYLPPISNLIVNMKHHAGINCISTLASLFEQGYQTNIGSDIRSDAKPRPDMIVCIPLNWRRHVRRGFNQSQCLAMLISKKLQIPLANNCLKRVQNTKPQQGLKRAERLKNLQNCFQASSAVDGKTIALFDDVITTGATMQSATQTLKEAGAKSVLAWSIARTA